MAAALASQRKMGFMPMQVLFMIGLQKDTVNLPEVVVYPWPSREAFARAFVEMDPYEDAIRRAQRELSGESLAFIAARVDGDASLAAGYLQNQLYTQLYRGGQLPANNLFNPYAWAKFIDEWKKVNVFYSIMELVKLPDGHRSLIGVLRVILLLAIGTIP